jgi:hypothetical protein
MDIFAPKPGIEPVTSVQTESAHACIERQAFVYPPGILAYLAVILVIPGGDIHGS